MPGERLKPLPRADFIARLTQSTLTAAIEELIWNAFDEDARVVRLSADFNKLDGVDRIVITDDGKSATHDKAREAFQNLGNSDKPNRKSDSGERLHGSKGEGRHKALSLGQTVIWTFTHEVKGKLLQFKVEGTAGREDPFYISSYEPAPASAARGCSVEIKDIQKSLAKLGTNDARRELTVQFAPFLLRHPDKQLFFLSEPIRPKDAIQEFKRLRSFNIDHDGNRYAVSIDVAHWRYKQDVRDVLLCSHEGVPYHSLTSRALPASGDYSVFVRSDLFSHLHRENQLPLIEMATHDNGRAIVQKIRSKIRSYFIAKAKSEAETALDRLKREGSYPYAAKPETGIARVEQQVFDVCAVNISRHLPSFNDGMDVDSRKLLLRVVREALSQNPTSVGKIIREVCRLPEKEAVAFADLIEDVPLGSVVHTARRIADRLSFLKFLNSVVYLDPFTEVIKERTQLHRIVAHNTWLFGEEYAIGTDDQNIQTILEKHIKILGRKHLQPELSDADYSTFFKRLKEERKGTSESLSRIPDLMLWKKFVERRADEHEFLIIELKRPTVAIGRKEIQQIEDYANAVVNTPFADKDRTRWVFAVVSDTLDEHAQQRANQHGLPQYTILKPSGCRYEIQIWPWDRIIRDAEARHEHLKSWLNHNPTLDQAMEKTSLAYKDLLPPSRIKENGATAKPKAKARTSRSDSSDPLADGYA